MCSHTYKPDAAAVPWKAPKHNAVVASAISHTRIDRSGIQTPDIVHSRM